MDEYADKTTSEIENKPSIANANGDRPFVKRLLTVLPIVAVIGYALIIVGVNLRFIPINDGSWLSIGMGKLVLIGSILGIIASLRRKNFASFFISLFILFFVFHEIIVFYDLYAINLGKELTSDGVYRSVIQIYKEAFTSLGSGAFWSLLGGLLSILSVLFNWLITIVNDNYATKDIAVLKSK